MPTLSGRRIALLENRSSAEIATLVKRLGGEPVTAPALDEVPRHDDFNVFTEGLAGSRFSLVIFLTGTGARTLLAEAERRGSLDEVIAALHQATIACRGPKPLAVLKHYGLRAQIATSSPHTTRELMDGLGPVEIADRGVLLVHYGERNAEIPDTLRLRGARLSEVCPYEWRLPQDLGPVTGVVRDVLAHRLDAVLFTSQIQCRHLFQVAEDMGEAKGLALNLNNDIVVAAVGPVCAAALRKLGVTPDVIPSAPNMPSLIAAVAEYFDLLSND